MTEAERLILNVGGTRFEVSRSTLAHYPDSRLGKYFAATSSAKKADADGSFFFDRNGRIFEAVLDFIRTGEVIVPADSTEDLLKKEFQYWELQWPNKDPSPSRDKDRHEHDGSDSDDPSADGDEISDDEDEQDNVPTPPHTPSAVQQSVSAKKSPKQDPLTPVEPLPTRFVIATGLIRARDRDTIRRGLNILLDVDMELPTAAPAPELEDIRKEIKYHIAYAYHRLGAVKEAKSSLNEIIKLNSNDKQAKDLLLLVEDTGSNYIKAGFAFLAVGIIGVVLAVRWWNNSSTSSSTSESASVPTVLEAAAIVVESAVSATAEVANATIEVAQAAASVAEPIVAAAETAVDAVAALVPNSVAKAD